MIINENYNINFFNTDVDFLAISYENDKNEIHTSNLINTFKKFNYPYKMVGYGEKWNGWYGRTMAYKNKLLELNPETYILQCDGRDVLINRSCKDLISTALKLCKNKIIVGTETWCFTGMASEKIQKYK